MKAIITTIDEEFQKAGKKGMKWHVKHAKKQGRKLQLPEMSHYEKLAYSS
jgi:hypothetical protein